MLRDGQQASIPADELVPGDIVLLKSGDKVPADVRLISAANLQVCGEVTPCRVPPELQSIWGVGALFGDEQMTLVCNSVVVL